MNELMNDEERAFLRSVREEGGPPAERRDALLRASRARIAALDPAITSHFSSMSGPATRASTRNVQRALSTSRLVQGALLGLLAGGSIGFFVGRSVSRQGAPHDSSQVILPVRATEVASHVTDAEERSMPPPSIPAEPGPSAPHPVEKTEAREPKNGAERASAPAADVASESTAEPTLYEEMVYLRRAQKALATGNPALARGLMESLRRLSPAGALLVERNVTEVLALCELGRTEEAERLAQVVLRQQPNSVYAGRLRSSCAGEGERVGEAGARSPSAEPLGPESPKNQE